MDAPTNAELFRIARDAMLMNNPKLTKDIVDREGTDYNAICAGIATMGDEVVSHNIKICSSNSLASARGEKLTRYVFDKYGLLRKPASVALGSVAFSSPTAPPAPYNIPSNFKLRTTDGRQFITTASVAVSAGNAGPITVPVRSVLAGLSQQAQKNTITSMADTIQSAPEGLAVTNTLATAGADDEENDDDLRSRAQRYYETIRAGTIAAIENRARAYPGIRRATVIERLDSYGRPTKVVQLIIADGFTDVLVQAASFTYEAQSQVLADAVYLDLDDTRGAGIFVDVRVAQVVMQSVLLALNFEANADIEDAAIRARAAVVEYINRLPPGADFVPANVRPVLEGIPGLVVTGTEVMSPIGTIVTSTHQVLRATMGCVRATTLQPDRALQGTTSADSVS